MFYVSVNEDENVGTSRGRINDVLSSNDDNFQLPSLEAYLVDEICCHTIAHLTEPNEPNSCGIGRHHPSKVWSEFHDLECHFISRTNVWIKI